MGTEHSVAGLRRAAALVRMMAREGEPHELWGAMDECLAADDARETMLSLITIAHRALLRLGLPYPIESLCDAINDAAPLTELPPDPFIEPPEALGW